ncbi:unnamed protein product [Diadromus pulchellus idnoreovirus 1]|uniref:Uncharacterized protein S9 n=1 Tax=Diadromus pulchellus idnoreovirus 1 TaxID=37368 RepID=S9_DPIRV|nr:unnamed protein product [Diadromus pulchellus idnoreovirus 1]Q86283.1 RecName: Full=Uncharacterized protein S9 [Diadromus pulchellus idnoreovirus 1]CAA57562.1 unnamed protein product [Diadromus pulchellus idnoreovirus 1]
MTSTMKLFTDHAEISVRERPPQRNNNNQEQDNSNRPAPRRLFGLNEKYNFDQPETTFDKLLHQICLGNYEQVDDKIINDSITLAALRKYSCEYKDLKPEKAPKLKNECMKQFAQPGQVVEIIGIDLPLDSSIDQDDLYDLKDDNDVIPVLRVYQSAQDARTKTTENKKDYILDTRVIPDNFAASLFLKSVLRAILLQIFSSLQNQLVKTDVATNPEFMRMSNAFASTRRGPFYNIASLVPALSYPDSRSVPLIVGFILTQENLSLLSLYSMIVTTKVSSTIMALYENNSSEEECEDSISAASCTNQSNVNNSDNIRMTITLPCGLTIAFFVYYRYTLFQRRVKCSTSILLSS